MAHFAHPTECPNCHSRMLLHEPSLEQIIRHLGRWSRDEWYINLLCGSCGHGYTQPGPPLGAAVLLDDPDPHLSRSGPTIFRAVFECENKNCEAPVVCFAFRGNDATVESVKAEHPKWESAGVDCQCIKGHAPHRPLRFRYEAFFVPLRK